MLGLIKEEGFDFAFDAKACEECGGGCCIGESGYIWVTPTEIKVLSRNLKLKTDDFITKYLSKIGYRYSLKELEFNGGFKCVFFDIEKKMCSVYENRPKQCRTFPFWDHFKNNIREVEEECPGIYRL
ncbi:MAG TPA: YkgJ family cysteine cluster protein [Sulfurospirillum arcachonense]|nr:YkgJ family cysteine cluster protein [Sulfurospirillum arcachonense]HIP45854.1 YkgJ family cysteine cluster protein [Sulfurospirillum arcachonense]